MAEGVLAELALLVPPAEVAARLRLPPGPLLLRRAWPRAADHLLLEYEALGGLVVPGQWRREHADAASIIANLDEEACALVELRGAPGWVTLQLHGADQRLPGLAPLLRRPRAALLVHQPGRRAVVRLAEGRDVAYAKVVRPGRARPLAVAGEAAPGLGAGAFDAPRLIDLDEAAGVLVWSEVRGAPLYELRGAALARGAHAAGMALRALHGAAGAPPAALHDAGAERATLERWLGHLAAFDAAIAARAAARAAAVYAALAGAPGPLTSIHRDFYDRQILVAADGRVGLLDFDTLARGEAALDLANVLVHLWLRSLQGVLGAAEAAAAQVALLAGYGPAPEDRARLGAYADAARLRLACVYSFRPRWRRCFEALIASESQWQMS